jgi:hypothetical protein
MQEMLREPVEDLRKIENDPSNIRLIRNPTLDEQLLSVNNNPHSIQYIKHPLTIVMQTAVQLDPTTIKHFWRKATKEIRRMALEGDASVIRYLPDASIEEQKFAMKKNQDCYDMIKNKTWKTTFWQLVYWVKFVV